MCDAIQKAHDKHNLSPLDYNKKWGQVIVCAANRNQFGEIVLGARHFDVRMHAAINVLRQLDAANKIAPVAYIWEQGFINQFGEFLDRKDAMIVATAANQVNKHDDRCPVGTELYSENLY